MHIYDMVPALQINNILDPQRIQNAAFPEIYSCFLITARGIAQSLLQKLRYPFRIIRFLNIAKAVQPV